MEVIMKTSLLEFFRVGSLVATLGLATPQVYASPQPQQSSLPLLLFIGQDSQLLMPELAVPATNEQRQTTKLYNLVQELRALPVGKTYGYYLQVLEQQGYLVLSNYKDHRHWEFTLEKTQQNLRLTIAYNVLTGTSTMITASGPRVADQSHTDETNNPFMLRLHSTLCCVANSSHSVL